MRKLLQKEITNERSVIIKAVGEDKKNPFNGEYGYGLWECVWFPFNMLRVEMSKVYCRLEKLWAYLYIYCNNNNADSDHKYEVLISFDKNI